MLRRAWPLAGGRVSKGAESSITTAMTTPPARIFTFRNAGPAPPFRAAVAVASRSYFRGTTNLGSVWTPKDQPCTSREVVARQVMRLPGMDRSGGTFPAGDALTKLVEK